MSTLSCLMKLQGVKMDDTASEHTKAEVGKRPLEDLRDAFGSDLLALVEGHDVDVDVRQRNREFVSSNKHGKSWKIVSDVPQPPISPSLHGTSDPGEPVRDLPENVSQEGIDARKGLLRLEKEGEI